MAKHGHLGLKNGREGDGDPRCFFYGKGWESQEQMFRLFVGGLMLHD